MSVKAVLFDLDMTLLDSSAVEEYRRNKLWSRVRAEIGQVKPIPVKSGVKPHFIPGLLKKQGVQVGVVTNSPRWYAEHLLKTFKVPFDALVAYGDTTDHKPDPEPLQLALSQLKVSADEALHVGDDVLDTEASHHAGVTSVGAAWALASTGRAAVCQAASEMLLWKPGLLLKPDDLSPYRYLGEAMEDGESPRWHTGSTLWWKDKSRTVQCLGRYLKTEDPRHATHAWTSVVLANKNGDQHADLLGRVLAEYLKNTVFKPDYVVAVPPKPGQRNRFEKLMKAAKRLLPSSVTLKPDGLKCVKGVEGYKNMGYAERQAAVRKAYTTDYSWTGKVVLLDDVYTTGATSEACAKVLIADGAAEIRTVAFGLTQKAFGRKFCPECSRPMRIRTERATGDRFWGCTGYPNLCKNTERL